MTFFLYYYDGKKDQNNAHDNYYLSAFNSHSF